MKLETHKEKLVEKLKNISDSEDEMDQICLFAMVREIEVRYSTCYSESCNHYKACVYNCMKDDPLWRKLSGYWGKGIDGYRKKIIVEIIEELERKNIAAKLFARYRNCGTRRMNLSTCRRRTLFRVRADLNT